MKRTENKYAEFVEHPRYGNRPLFTGLNPKAGEKNVFLHWHSPESCRIPGTAVVADTTRQNYTTVPVTHYFDVERVCCDCRRPFIFFALEQKYWYEILNFKLDANCIRCPICRKRDQRLSRDRQRYEELLRRASRTFEEDVEITHCCLNLIEAGVTL
jgi:hypothetical protein